MNDPIPSLAQLLRQLQQIPYLASKNLYRVAEHLLRADVQKVEQLCHAIVQAKNNIHPCAICFTWQEKEKKCQFCDDVRRNQRLICVVESWQELMAVERTSSYQGVYHVLGGLICPLDGIGPQDLHIQPLLERLQQHGADEVIFALSQTPEGEATALFIAQRLRPLNIRLTCFSRGIPVGSALEHLDRLTVYKALSERRPF